MKVYAVGGSVRDQLLGLEVRDQDYVVVGSTPEEMERLGFKRVGSDFPVFLHPVTREEYALARSERKSGRGYRGFTIKASPDVTLEQDLGRRDLTINAIARDEDGRIIDPFDGTADLRKGILRHVGPAFVEDPVRVLRTARFAARFGFAVAAETCALMRQMAANGEVDHLVAERVWQEISKGLMESKPSRMFEVLRECQALARILPELDALYGVPQPEQYHPEIDTGVHIMMVIDYAAKQQYSLAVRFAALTHDLGKGLTPRELWPSHHGHEQKSVELVESLCKRLRVPGHCRDVARLTARYHGDIGRAYELRPATILKLLDAVDAFRKPGRFDEILQAAECDFRGRSGYEEAAFPQAGLLRQAGVAAREVDAGAIAAGLDDPAKIRAQIDAARIVALGKAVTQFKDGS
ncbi:MAG: 2', 3'-cyclic nucleotide 2'-phosphodiesterase [Betaproteobacteria bacterium SG8_40]|nr:MAG: 2', 3'-cyclic nucleotide 2'-phosphodiesterase [Betaproteobacteria bacterium SG8_40]